MLSGRGRALLFHLLDNEGAKHLLIEGSLRAIGANRIVHTTWEVCVLRRPYPWWDRVSASDNPVDAASRRDMRHLYEQGWEFVQPTLPPSWHLSLDDNENDASWQRP